MGNSDYKQAYKGPSTSFLVHGLQPSSDYRFRVCAIRQCQDSPELSGPYSPTVTLSPQRNDAAGQGSGSTLSSRAGCESSRSRRSLTDEQCAFLILMLFAIIAILIAFVIQYFVIKWVLPPFCCRAIALLCSSVSPPCLSRHGTVHPHTNSREIILLLIVLAHPFFFFFLRACIFLPQNKNSNLILSKYCA